MSVSYASLLKDTILSKHTRTTQVALLGYSGLASRLLLKTPISLFWYHPALQSFALVLLVQGILVVQPSDPRSPQQIRAKRLDLHQALNGSATTCAAIASGCIYANKARRNAPHYQSYHGIIGALVTLGFVLLSVFGVLVGREPTKSWLKGPRLWKYHRLGGYLVTSLAFLNAILAIQYSVFSVGSTAPLERALSTIALASVLLSLLTGLRPQKLGFR